MTLFVEKGAVILGTNNTKLWNLIPFLPSYGRGRDHDGDR